MANSEFNLMLLRHPSGTETRRTCSRAPNPHTKCCPECPNPEDKKTRPKVRIKVRSKFDRAGGAVDGEFIYDKETGKVTVREKGAKTAYSIGMAELCEYIARRGLGFAR